MTDSQLLKAALWTLLWVPLTLLVAVLSMRGDPVPGGHDTIAWTGRIIVAIGFMILVAGYWRIFRKRSH